jgi:hypothetical protein
MIGIGFCHTVNIATQIVTATNVSELLHAIMCGFERDRETSSEDIMQ